MLFPPAKKSVPVETSAKAPEVLPPKVTSTACPPEAVIVPLLSPKDTPFAFPKVKPPKAPVVVPAETLKFAAAAVLAEIVIDCPFCESVTLLPPARNSVPVEISEVVPAVLPAA